MDWEILYYNENVQELINAWPVGIRAFYARVTERMEIFGPNLGMPFTRSMGNGMFEIRARGKEGIGRAFFLHNCRSQNHYSSWVHQEDPENT